MMNYFILALLSVACFVQHSESHSWLDCTKDVGTGLNTGVNDCQGFARGYPGRVGGSNIDRIMTYRIQPGIDGQNGPICAPNQQTANYSSNYYMATARAGETLRLRWTPNGHQKGAGQDPKTYTIHWTGTPNTQLTTRLQLTDANKLAGPFEFDETCFCDNCAGNPCYGRFTIPPSTAPGTYSFIWYWVFDRNPSGSGEEYSTCFDVKVTGSVATTPSTQRTTAQTSQQRTSAAATSQQRTSATATSQQRTQTQQRTSSATQQRTTATSQSQQKTSQDVQTTEVETFDLETSESSTELITNQITTSAETDSANVLYSLFSVVCTYIAILLL